LCIPGPRSQLVYGLMFAGIVNGLPLAILSVSARALSTGAAAGVAGTTTVCCATTVCGTTTVCTTGCCGMVPGAAHAATTIKSAAAARIKSENFLVFIVSPPPYGKMECPIRLGLLFFESYAAVGSTSAASSDSDTLSRSMYIEQRA